MNTPSTTLPTRQKQNIILIKALVLSLPMLFLTLLMLTQGKFPTVLSKQMALLLSYGFINAIFFLMLYTGKTDKYRAIFFITASLCFVLSFITNMIEGRGSMSFTASTSLDGGNPLCPLVIPMLILPAVLTQTIIFPGSLFAGHAAIATVLVMWLGASLAIGRGWCSWVCFFGGMDEGCSRLCKKPKITTINKKWTYLPFAVLFSIVLLSAITLSPVYCEWLCPFKTVTEFAAVTSFKILVQTIIFLSLFIGLVIVLPILTGRRAQCGLFCPFAAFQSFTNKINVFAVRIDTQKCINCKRCIAACPTFSLDEDSLKQGKTLLTCTKCGKCIDHCPCSAISYHIKGTPVSLSPETARLLFMYPAFLFGATIGGGSIYSALDRILKLLMTGSFF